MWLLRRSRLSKDIFGGSEKGEAKLTSVNPVPLLARPRTATTKRMTTRLMVRRVDLADLGRFVRIASSERSAEGGPDDDDEEGRRLLADVMAQGDLVLLKGERSTRRMP
jgi:hypothetical protein